MLGTLDKLFKRAQVFDINTFELHAYVEYLRMHMFLINSIETVLFFN